MSANLKKAMELKGAVGAIEFDKDGRLVSSQGDVPEKVANMLADMFFANLKMAKMQAHLFTVESGIDGFGDELTGFAMMGNDLSFCVIENIGLIIKNNEADLNLIYETLANL